MITIPGVDPIFMWVGFLLLVFILLGIDLGVFHRRSHTISTKEALLWAAVWISMALLFNVFVWLEFGKEVGLQFFTGYLLEKSLSIDNLFVFILIFTTFNIHPKFQHRVLFWGILGALITRGLFIGLGVALVQAFDWIFLVFGLVILYGAYRMQFGKEETFDPEKSIAVRMVRKVFPVSHTPDEQHFFTIENGKRAVTTLFITLVVIELSDIIFAFDSIPAILAITQDPFIVFTSNIFAILGLRSLYFVLENMHSMFHYLKDGISFILFFIAIKLFLFPFGIKIPLLISLTVIVAVLTISIVASIIFNSIHKRDLSAPEHHHDLRTHVSKIGNVATKEPPKI